MKRGDGFGNAREMRKLFECVVRRQAHDLDQPSLAGTTLLRRIDANAFPPAAEPSHRYHPPGYV